MLMPTSVQQAIVQSMNVITSRVARGDDRRNEADADPGREHSSIYGGWFTALSIAVSSVDEDVPGGRSS
jgi:hypothetical protein